MSELEKYLLMALTGFLCYFARDIVGKFSRDSRSVSKLEEMFSSFAATVNELKSSVLNLQKTLHEQAVIIAGLSAGFVSRQTFDEANGRLHKRLDELNNIVITGSQRKTTA